MCSVVLYWNHYYPLVFAVITDGRGRNGLYLTRGGFNWDCNVLSYCIHLWCVSHHPEDSLMPAGKHLYEYYDLCPCVRARDLCVRLLVCVHGGVGMF